MAFSPVLIFSLVVAVLAPALPAHALENTRTNVNSNFDDGADEDAWDDWGSGPAAPRPFAGGGIPGFSAKKKDPNQKEETSSALNDDGGSLVPGPSSGAGFGQAEGRLRFRIVREGEESTDRHSNHYHRKVR